MHTSLKNQACAPGSMRLPTVLALAAAAGLVLAGCTGGKPERDTLVLADGTEVELDGAGTSATRGAIAGVVVDEAIRPVPGALVALAADPTVNATVDDAGVFLLGDLEPGLQVLSVSAAGFFPIQTSVDVAAGETSRVKVQLPVDARPQPYHDTVKLDGFMQAWAGIGQFVIEVVVDGGSGLCNCRIQVQPTGNVSDFVIEAFWEESTPDPAGLAEFYLSVSEEPGGFLETDYCYSPCRMQISADAVDYAGGVVEARLDGADAWVSYQQQFTLFVTTFYNGEAPDDWSIATAPA